MHLVFCDQSSLALCHQWEVPGQHRCSAQKPASQNSEQSSRRVPLLGSPWLLGYASAPPPCSWQARGQTLFAPMAAFLVLLHTNNLGEDGLRRDYEHMH